MFFIKEDTCNFCFWHINGFILVLNIVFNHAIGKKPGLYYSDCKQYDSKGNEALPSDTMK